MGCEGSFRVISGKDCTDQFSFHDLADQAAPAVEVPEGAQGMAREAREVPDGENSFKSGTMNLSTG